MERLRQLMATDIPFARDDAHRLLPAMIACLVGFAALLFAASLSLNNTLDAQSSQVIGRLQVEVPRARANEKGVMENVMALLERTPGVEEVALLTDSQLQSMLKPWLGDDIALDELDVPMMIDVKTTVKKRASTVDVDALERALRVIDKNIRLSDRGPLVNNVAQATSLLQYLIIFIALLLLACVIGMIVLVSKTNLRLHFKTVSLLHMFGATDDYILRQFQKNSVALAGRGAIIGTICAMVIFVTTVILSLRLKSALMPEISFHFSHVLLFIALPVLTAAIAFAATRATVKTMLGHMH